MSNPLKDGPVLFYCKDGVLYPIVMTQEKRQMFELAVSVLNPLKVLIDQPQGSAVNLLKGDDTDAT